MANEALTAAQGVTTQIITLSTGLVTLTVTFAEQFAVDGSKGLTVPLPLKISWLFYGLSVALGILTLMAITGTLNELEAGKPGNANRSNINWPARAMVCSFLLGVSFTIVAGFMIVN